MQTQIETDLDNIQKKVKELLNSANPYELLKTETSIREHLPLLNNLHPTDKGLLAARIAFECPISEPEAYKQIISTFLNTPEYDSDSEERKDSESEAESGFCEVLFSALEAKRVIDTILNPKNPKPHKEFLADEDGLLTAFRESFMKCLKGKEFSLAQNLALSTPSKKLDLVYKRINEIFNRTDFVQMVQRSFSIKFSIKKELLGKNPSAFFLHPEYPAESYIKYSKLFEHFLTGKEISIGEKLAAINSAETFFLLTSRLDSLKDINAFKQIAGAMVAKKERESANGASFACNSSQFFSNSELIQRKLSTLDEIELNTSSDKIMNLGPVEEQAPNCCEKYCTLF